MQLHNTLTRQTEDFTPQDGNLARVYTCGPTVYDHIHIGNLRAYIFADTLHRALELAGHDVQRVMNYTDIDDKTVRRSHERYADEDPMEALQKLTAEYISVFHRDMQQVGNRIDNLTFMPATDNIAPMQGLITQLHKNGFAYMADDGVYFSIDAYRKSGKTYGQLLEITADSTSKARIENDEYDKESIHDFALWKKQKPGEPAWPFTLDGQDLTGRPGWHIECSAMSHKGLGQPFDIHTGGIDNIFPHHENEIAQSTAGQESPVMATFFVHNDHILVDGKKMAKSAQNFYTLEDVIARKYDPLAFRLLVLQAHYRTQLNFTWESMDAAQNRLQNLRALADLRFQNVGAYTKARPTFAGSHTSNVRKAMLHDLRTPQALKAVSLAETEVEMLGIAPDEQKDFLEYIKIVDQALGLQLLDSTDITAEQKELLAARGQAREAKDWATSDELRDKLTAQGLGVRDTPQGPLWYRT